MTDKLKKRQSLSKNWKKYFTLLVLILLAVGIAFLLDSAPVLAQQPPDVEGFQPRELLLRALRWIKSQGPIGGLAFIGLYIVATVAFLPGSIVTLGAGVVFGIFYGTILVFIGSTLGATAAFLIGRYLARRWVYKIIASNEDFKAIDTAVGKEGLKIVILTRLSPIFPFNVLNYAFGVTSVSLKDYVTGSVGMLPGTMMYVYIGSLAGSCALIGTKDQPSDSLVEWIMRIMGFIATVAVTVHVTRIAKAALERRK
jgi:uncharacterized membrane protein YdjX (TVP38/TMEM64 family)